MSTPVVTDKWAGNFDCDFCRRKRLMGDEFSKTALNKYRKQGGKLKCKQCVQQTEEQERKAAAEKRNNQATLTASGDSSSTDFENETRECSSCNEVKKFGEYNRNQWNKGENKSRCRICVEKSIKDEAKQQTDSKQLKIQKAKHEVEKAKKSGNAQAILKAESELSALEAEQVTGLKPVKMGGRGRGRGGGRFRGGGGRGRGRGGRK